MSGRWPSSHSNLRAVWARQGWEGTGRTVFPPRLLKEKLQARKGRKDQLALFPRSAATQSQGPSLPRNDPQFFLCPMAPNPHPMPSVCNSFPSLLIARG